MDWFPLNKGGNQCGIGTCRNFRWQPAMKIQGSGNQFPAAVTEIAQGRVFLDTKSK
jgi:hypothetical protein